MSDKDTLFSRGTDSQSQGEVNNQEQQQANVTADDPRQGTSNVAQNSSSDDMSQLFSRLDAKDAHIKQIKSENAELRVKAAKVDELERRLEELMSGQSQQAQAQEQVQINPDDIASQVLNQLSAKEKAAQQEANLDKVYNKLKKEYGDRITEEWLNAANDNGFSKEELTDLAANRPDFVLRKVFAFDQGNTTSSAPQPTHSSVRVQQLSADTPEAILANYNLKDAKQLAEARQKLRELVARA